MSQDKQLHGTVVHQLPPDINLRKIQAHASIQSGLGKAWGETYLLVHENELVLLTRGSVFDEYERTQVVAGHIPRLEEGASMHTLTVQTLAGDQTISVKRSELPEVKRLIAALENLFG